jgi:hypothetical protein
VTRGIAAAVHSAAVEAWIAALAAGGGLVLGLGLGVVLGRRDGAVARASLRRAEARLRASVVPVLESRALGLGIPAEQRASGADDSFEVAVELADGIRRMEERANIGFSDTIQAERAELQRRRR